MAFGPDEVQLSEFSSGISSQLKVPANIKIIRLLLSFGHRLKYKKGD